MSNLAKKLATKSFEGYLQVIKIKNGQVEILENLKYTDLKNIKKYKKEKDVFYTVNSSFNGKRGVKNLKNLRVLYVDIDFHKKINKENLKAEINFVIVEIWLMADRGEIPRPSKAIATGRGVHIYWDLEPSSYGALATWQQLEDFLYNKLKHLGVDKKATDASRVLRLPGTINSKSKTECYVYVEENNIYSMYDLRERYLNWRNKHNKEYVKKEKNNNKINFYNSYTLHLARARDIVKLVKIRKGNVTGYRNFILHCYAYWEGIYNRNTDTLKEMVYKLNNSFTEPLRDTEVNAILRCIPKAIESFLRFQEEVGKENIKVTKSMRNKGGYWYKNSTLIERLDITEKEQEQLETIIDKKEKYKRKNKNRVENRKNENGLTKREQQKQDTIKAIKRLKTQGFKQVEVAKKLNKSIRTIKGYWNL